MSENNGSKKSYSVIEIGTGIGISSIAVLVFLSYLRNREKTIKFRLAFKDTNLLDKTIVVTGCNVGLGKEVVEFMASKGATVIMGCRNVSKCESVANELIKKTGNNKIFPHHLDLEDFDSIATFAKSIPKCNILINNAGIMNLQMEQKHGIEKTILTNYVGPYLLTKLMLPSIIKTSIQDNSECRIINVGSRLEKNADISLGSNSNYSKSGQSFQWIHDGPQPYSIWPAYANSKICTLLTTHQLARDITKLPLYKTSEPKARVTVNAVTPGVVNTQLGRWAPQWQQTFFYPFKLLVMKSPEQGARSIILAALSIDLNGKTGKFFGEDDSGTGTGMKEVQPSRMSQLPELASELHTYTDKIIKVVQKG